MASDKPPDKPKYGEPYFGVEIIKPSEIIGTRPPLQANTSAASGVPFAFSPGNTISEAGSGTLVVPKFVPESEASSLTKSVRQSLSGTATAPQGRRSRRPAGSGFDRKPGRRPLKEYPLTEGDMQALAAMSLAATFCFSVAAGLFGFWMNVSMDMGFSPNTPKEVFAHWDTLRTLAIWATPFVALAGVGFVTLGGLKIHNIKKETTHD